jgi:hypothetical protein
MKKITLVILLLGISFTTTAQLGGLGKKVKGNNIVKDAKKAKDKSQDKKEEAEKAATEKTAGTKYTTLYKKYDTRYDSCMTAMSNQNKEQRGDLNEFTRTFESFKTTRDSIKSNNKYFTKYVSMYDKDKYGASNMTKVYQQYLKTEMNDAIVYYNEARRINFVAFYEKLFSTGEFKLGQLDSLLVVSDEIKTGGNKVPNTSDGFDKEGIGNRVRETLNTFKSDMLKNKDLWMSNIFKKFNDCNSKDIEEYHFNYRLVNDQLNEYIRAVHVDSYSDTYFRLDQEFDAYINKDTQNKYIKLYRDEVSKYEVGKLASYFNKLNFDEKPYSNSFNEVTAYHQARKENHLIHDSISMGYYNLVEIDVNKTLKMAEYSSFYLTNTLPTEFNVAALEKDCENVDFSKKVYFVFNDNAKIEYDKLRLDISFFIANVPEYKKELYTHSSFQLKAFTKISDDSYYVSLNDNIESQELMLHNYSMNQYMEVMMSEPQKYWMNITVSDLDKSGSSMGVEEIYAQFYATVTEASKVKHKARFEQGTIYQNYYDIRDNRIADKGTFGAKYVNEAKAAAQKVYPDYTFVKAYPISNGWDYEKNAFGSNIARWCNIGIVFKYKDDPNICIFTSFAVKNNAGDNGNYVSNNIIYEVAVRQVLTKNL